MSNTFDTTLNSPRLDSKETKIIGYEYILKII